MAKKSKKLKLKPSARDKRRYFLVKSTNERIEKAILEYIGVLGFAKAAYLPVKKELGKNSKKLPKDFLVGSCLTKSLNEVRAALAMAGIKIEKVSGTLKALSK